MCGKNNVSEAVTWRCCTWCSACKRGVVGKMKEVRIWWYRWSVKTMEDICKEKEILEVSSAFPSLQQDMDQPTTTDEGYFRAGFWQLLDQKGWSNKRLEKGFIICTLHQMLSGWAMWAMKYFRSKWDKHIQFWLQNLTERDLSLEESIRLTTQRVNVLIELNWFRPHTVGNITLKSRSVSLQFLPESGKHCAPKITAFRDVTLCSVTSSYPHFRRTRRLHL